MLVATALMWGLAGVCVKSLTWGAGSIIAVKSLLSMILVAAATRKIKFRFTKENVAVVLLMVATCSLYTIAIKLTTAGTAIALQYINPILVLLYGIVFQKRKPRPIEIILVFAVFAGCVLAFADTLDFTHILGNALAIVSGFCLAGEIIIMSGGKCDNESCTVWSNGLSFLIFLPLLLTDKALTFDTKNVVWILISGLIQFGLANILYAKGIRKVDQVEAALILTIEPVFNPIPVAIFCGEMMGPLAIAGSVIVIISIIIYTLLPRFTKHAGTV